MMVAREIPAIDKITIGMIGTLTDLKSHLIRQKARFAHRFPASELISLQLVFSLQSNSRVTVQLNYRKAASFGMNAAADGELHVAIPFAAPRPAPIFVLRRSLRPPHFRLT